MSSSRLERIADSVTREFLSQNQLSAPEWLVLRGRLSAVQTMTALDLSMTQSQRSDYNDRRWKDICAAMIQGFVAGYFFREAVEKQSPSDLQSDNDLLIHGRG